MDRRLLAPVTLVALAFLAAGIVLATWTADAGAPSSATNGLLAFVRTGGREARILTLDPASGETRELVAGPGTAGEPAWSPDGTRLAYVARDATYGGYHLYVHAVASGETTRLLDGPAIDGSPSWSPDGARIAFSSNRGPGDGGTSGGFAVFTIDVDGTDLRRVGPGLQPRWSPDGRRIALTRLVDGMRDLFDMAADGRDVRNLTASPDDERDPTWSPDGRWIVFSRLVDGHDRLFLLSPADGALRPLLDGAGDDGHPGDDRYPAWAPDGRSVVFSRRAGDTRHLWLAEVDAAGVARNARQLTDDPLVDVSPAWQPIRAP